MTTVPSLSRRGFIVGTGATGLTIGILAACGPGGKDAPAEAGPPPPEVNAWVHIGTDDIVTVRIARSEMGQGTLTGLAQFVEEKRAAGVGIDVRIAMLLMTQKIGENGWLDG